MVSTKTLSIYIMIVIFFYFFIGIFNFSDDTSKTDILLSSLAVYKNEIETQQEEENKWYENIYNIVKFPFVIFDLTIDLIGILISGFIIVPFVLNTLILLPMGIIILFDYILPLIRGN